MYTLSTYAWMHEYALGNLYNEVQVLGDICVGSVERLLRHSQREICCVEFSELFYDPLSEY